MQETIQEWAGKWICSGLEGGPGTSVAAPLMRREFTLPAKPVRAWLHITALGLYQARLNGQAVGDDVLAPGWTDYGKRVAYQSHEVTSLLRPGANVLGVILGDGWYCGFLSQGPRQTHGDRPELLLQLEVELADGQTVHVTSDAEWTWQASAILENDLLMGEAYDARKERPGWDQPGSPDGAWWPVEVRGPRAIEVVRSAAPPMRRQETVPGVLRRERGRQRLYDLGQNLTGWVRLRVKAARGTHLKIRHAEILDAQGDLYLANLRMARAMDQYTCRGGEEETWEPLFTFHGFRYVEITGLPPEAACDVDGIVAHTDMRETAQFSCSNPLLNQLWSNIRWGMKGNFLDVPTDCPQRDERMGWTGDAQVFCRTAALLMDVRGFFDKWLQDVRDAQLPGGGIPNVVPNVGHFKTARDSGPAWADAVIICPWTLYLSYGRLDVLRDHYACMKRYMDFLERERTREHIRSHPDVDDWGGFGDWLSLDEGSHTPKDLIGTALYANNADIMARTAGLLDKPEEAARWRALREKIVAAFQRRFITADGLIQGGSQTAYVLALHFGLVPEDRLARAMGELVRLIEQSGRHLATGFVGTPYILDVLEAGGRLDLAYALLEQETYPSWLFPVKSGATTIWERWDGWTPEGGFQDPGMNSFNHYAYGAVGAWMMRRVAGIDLEEAAPGYEVIRFQPRPGGSLTSARASLDTPAGEAVSEWKREEGRLVLRLTVPEGARGRLLPPDGCGPEEELSAGTHQREWSVGG